jgi:hypothetical protein
MKNAIWLGLGVALVLCAADRAYAHGGLPVSQSIMRQAGGDLMYVPVTFWGVWVGQAGGPWKWICEEEINTNRFRRMALSTDGAFYATDARGVTVSADHGCTWKAATGDLAMLHTTDVAVDPVDGATAYVTSGDGGTTASDGAIVPANNAVFVTHDHGAHFAPLPSLTGRVYLSVRVAPSDPKTLYVTSASSMAPLDLAVHRSSDGGTSFTTTTLSYQLDGKQPYGLELMAIDPRTPDVVYARALGSGVNDAGDPVDRHALLRSTDGGATFTELWKLTGITNVSSGQTRGLDSVTVDPASGEVWVATNAGLLRGSDPGQAPTVTLTPTGRLSQAQCVDVHGGALYACSSQYVPDKAAIAASSDDGKSFSSALDYPQTLGPVDCPSGTPVGDNCPLYWYMYGSQLGVEFDAGVGNPDGATSPPQNHGCGCTVGGAASAMSGGLLACALALLLLGRRAAGTRKER